jgi:hypothetical protein
VPDFDGDTYNADRDQVRLSKQLKRVYEYLDSRRGHWVSLMEISSKTGDQYQSISARIRDLRKPKFGAHTVEHRNSGGGLWEYRLL